ncbi:hypothetical protein JHK86_019445 [Glycine max]|nr:hypothetical protein JHK86_019445 [Glycine max]
MLMLTHEISDNSNILFLFYFVGGGFGSFIILVLFYNCWIGCCFDSCFSMLNLEVLILLKLKFSLDWVVIGVSVTLVL